MLHKITYLLAAVTLAGVFFLLPQPSNASDNRTTGTRPLNIVFVVVDDLGWADLGCYEADLHETPRIDGLAQQGMRFTDAYAAAPVCSPTRASIFTGKHPSRLHMTIWYGAAVDPEVNKEKNPKLITPACEHNLPLDQVTIAEVLRRADYATWHVGKWHVGDPDHYPMAQGFDVNIGGNFCGCPKSFFYPFRGQDAPDIPLPRLESGQLGDYLTDRLTDEAIKLLDGHNDRPFFLHLAFYSVHTPIEGKPALVERYRQEVKDGMRHQNPAYAAMVHSVDENVGRVLDKLDSLGIADRTLVILFSDNGGAHYRGITNNHPLREGKGTLYEGGIRVPLIVRLPGPVLPGGVCRQPVLSTDFYSTILELTGIEGDAQHDGALDGTSLVPLLEDPAAGLKRDFLCWHYPHYYYGMNTPVGAIRQGDWKLLEYFEDGRLELYNLAADISEKNDLSASRPELAKRLQSQLSDWRHTIDAALPTPNPDWSEEKTSRAR